ncbi:hypothetical protein L1987_21586 [Smallanthus sonchifolius]|uniref:Uncharacterized protein n=1 Tax=Smallanthus sonchifolius TaxID=185202 RepID=A0ACB9IUB1_9ASTR|nr:hypothetical protein L1987_21586 [Smallanthus sonchifolius]
MATPSHLPITAVQIVISGEHPRRRINGHRNRLPPLAALPHRRCCTPFGLHTQGRPSPTLLDLRHPPPISSTARLEAGSCKSDFFFSVNMVAINTSSSPSLSSAMKRKNLKIKKKAKRGK